MSYRINQEDVFVRLGNSSFFSFAALRGLTRTLAAVDYSVVDSRRGGHTALNQFLTDGVDGWTIFDEETRFRKDSLRDVFVTDADAITSNLLISLANSLSWRATTNAKDTNAGTGAGKHEGNVVLAFDQGLQDNTKRYEELVKALGRLPNDGTLVWRRSTFEDRVATWSEGVGGSAKN